MARGYRDSLTKKVAILVVTGILGGGASKFVYFYFWIITATIETSSIFPTKIWSDVDIVLIIMESGTCLKNTNGLLQFVYLKARFVCKGLISNLFTRDLSRMH